MTLFNEGRRRA